LRERRILPVAVVVCLALAPGAGARAASLHPRARAEERSLLCRFVGRFIEVRYLGEVARAIALDTLDPQFALVVRVREVREGKLPERSREQLAFAVHSPARFYAGQGISPPAFLKPPAGTYLFSLWRLPKGRCSLEVMPYSPANAPSPCASALREHAVCDAANLESGRLFASRGLAGAVVVQDVRTGALVAFASARDPGDAAREASRPVDVKGSVLPLSLSKLLLAASWWDHEREIRRAPREQPIDVREMLVLGSDSAGRTLATELRHALGPARVLADLARYGFPECRSAAAESRDSGFWQALPASWQAQLTPEAACTRLSPSTTDDGWASTLSIGEADFSATLLHLSRFMQAVGNDGVMLPPVALRASDRPPAGGPATVRPIRVMRPGTARRLQAAMRQAVERGTARGIRGRLGRGWTIGGKTGSGPGESRPSDGCFAALAFDARGAAQYAVVTYVQRGGRGGGAAADISASLIEFVIGR
jgi:hypothetical protein